MTWHMIRLDLARTKSEPSGSQARCYLLRLPLDENGFVDPLALRAEPARATVLRSLPDEPDRAGHVGHRDDQWIFTYEPGEDEDESVFHLETHRLQPGDYLTVSTSDGEPLCFEVASCETDASVVS